MVYIEKSINSCRLIIGDCSNGLLTHGTLIGITRRLVVMGVGNQYSNSTENGKRRNAIST